jgi:hypothetical protein
MTGHRRAVNCRFVIAPPPGDRWVVVDMERRVAAEVFLRKGHMPLDCRKRDSMVRNEQSKRCEKVSCEMGRRRESVGEILHTFRVQESGVDLTLAFKLK